MSLFLTGCTSFVPTKIKFPEIPDMLMEPCTELEEVARNETRMSEFLKVVNKNYETYYDCKIKTDLIQKWYKTQKEIYKDITE
jgi:hypothetical protein